MISQWLLYFNAFWAVLGIFTGGLMSSALGAVLLVGSLGANVYGAYGIANELKVGYQVAIVASFLPFAIRLIVVFQAGAPLVRNLGFVLVPVGSSTRSSCTPWWRCCCTRSPATTRRSGSAELRSDPVTAGALVAGPLPSRPDKMPPWLPK